MTDILTNPSEAELFAAMEANYSAYPVGFACLARVELHEEPGLTWFISGGPPGNGVHITQLAPEQIDATIERVQQHFKAKGRRELVWQVLSSTRPANLGDYLLAHGFKPNGEEPFMVATLTERNAPVNTPANLRIERVNDTDTLGDWCRASAAGFGADVEAIQIFYDAYACLGFDPDGAWQHYVGYLGDEAVTSSTLLLAEGIAGIYDVSTVPSARRQGLGGAITRAAMAAAQARGYHHATLQASHEGYNLYRKLGFEEKFRRVDYVWRL